MISSFILLIVLFVGILGAIPYAIWILTTALKKRWRKVAYLMAAPIAAMVAVFLLCYAVSYAETLIQDRDVYDTYVVFSEPLFEYHSERAFNGDGYSLGVYPLPDSIRRRFEKVDAALLTKYPKRPGYRSHWFEEHWRKAPVDPAFEKYVRFALSESGKEDLKQQLSNLRICLERDTTYYSFFAYDHGEYPGDIDFFVVDLREGKVYIINHNT